MLFYRLNMAGIQNVEIERLPRAITLRVHVSRPGMVIGLGGSGLEELKKLIAQKLPQDSKTKKPPKLKEVWFLPPPLTGLWITPLDHFLRIW